MEDAGHQVVVSSNSLESCWKLYQLRPNLVILDMVTPTKDDEEICRRVREISDVPIVGLIPRGDEVGELKALAWGVDLCIFKPFSEPLLLARCYALVRRCGQSNVANKQTVTIGKLHIDLGKQEAFLNGEPLDLSPTEFRLLAALATRPGQVVPHRVLLSEVWGSQYADEDIYLKLYICYLRQKIESDPRQPAYILTRRGVGYYLNDRAGCSEVFSA